MAIQNAIETNEGLLGAGLIQHLKSYINLFVSEQVAMTNVDLGALSAKIAEIVNIVDGDPASEGYQAFQGLLTDVSGLKTDNSSNKTRLTAVEAALTAMDVAWKAEIARVEAESKARDTALGLRIDTVQSDISTYAAARIAKDAEHDGAIAALQAAKDTIITNLQGEVTRALAKETALNAAILANTAEIDGIKNREADYATRSNVDSAFVKFCQGAETELWAGRTKPAGLPTFTVAA